MSFKNINISVIAVLVLLGAVRLHASDEVEQTKARLNLIQTGLAKVRQNGLHTQDEGRVFILQKATTDVSASLEKNGLANLKTISLFQHLIVRFRFSTQFFEFIRTRATEAPIKAVLSAVDEIRQAMGIDDEPYSKILKINLTQIQANISALLKSDRASENLKKSLRALTPELGNAIAIADLGDRPKAFDKTKLLYGKIQDLYPSLHALDQSPAEFQIVLEIMGLNEFLGEYAQVNDA